MLTIGARYAWARGNELAEKLPADAEPAKCAPETANSGETQEDGLALSFGNRINRAP
jgi:hypothetical protein